MMMLKRRRTYFAPLLCSLVACAAPGEDENDDNGLDELADQAPFGQISIEAHAQPPEGGTASVSVSALGAVTCTGSVCFSNLFSTPTFTATPNAGWHFAQWTGCSAAGTSATVTLGATSVDERCTAVFEADPPPPMTPASPANDPPPQDPPPPLPPALPPPQVEPDPDVQDPSSWTPEERLTAKFQSLPPDVQAAFGQQLRGVTDCDEIPGWTDRWIGWFTEYEFGRVYAMASSSRANEIHGALYDAWRKNPTSNPTNSTPDSDETSAPDGRGRFSWAGGTFFVWTPETGAWAVHGWIQRVWEKLGVGNPAWGYPIGDHFSDDGTHCPQNGFYSLNVQPFEAGWVCADLDRAWVVPY